tara:strand:- start:74 stop:538 length:465 start_codon:yes stop_codon:yes gene_type:complete
MKESNYGLLLKQIDSIVDQKVGFYPNLGNILALIKEGLSLFWVGTYIVKENYLVLGPFQGPPACTLIPKGKGVCGQSWEKEIPFLVPDVHSFEGHIACNPNSKSEIVIPLRDKDKKVFMVLDIDSDKLNGLGQKELDFFKEVSLLIEKIYRKSH